MWRFFVKKQSKIINNVLLKNNINNNIKMWNNNIRINSNNYRFFHSTSFNRYHRFSPITTASSDTNNTVRKKIQYAVEKNKTYTFENKYRYTILRYLSLLEKQNLVTCNHYLFVLEACNLNVTDALTLLKRMEQYCNQSGEDYDNYATVKTYNMIMERCCHNSTEMWNLMLQYGINGLDPDVSTYQILLKQLFVEGEFDGAQKMYNQLPKNVISELSPDIEVVLNETGYLKNELLNEIRGEYFDKLNRLKNVTASREFLSLATKKDFIDNELYNKIKYQEPFLQLCADDSENIAFSTSKNHEVLHDKLLFDLLIEGNYDKVQKVLKSEATRMFYEKQQDNVNRLLHMNDDDWINQREKKIYKKLKYNRYDTFANDNNLTFASMLLEKIEQNGVADAKLYNFFMLCYLTSDEMLEYLNYLNRKNIDLETVRNFGKTVDFQGLEYLVNVIQKENLQYFEENEREEREATLHAERTSMDGVVPLSINTPVVDLHDIIINQILLEGNYSKAKSVCKYGIKDAHVQKAFLTYIDGHENSYKTNANFRLYVLNRRLDHLAKCIDKDKVEQARYASKVHESPDAQLKAIYLNNTNEFLSTLADNNVDDLSSLYHALICDYGKERFDSYEMEQYVNTRNNTFLNIQQYNVYFQKLIDEGRFEDAILQLDLILATQTNKNGIQPNMETYNIFALAHHQNKKNNNSDWIESLKNNNYAKSIIKDMVIIDQEKTSDIMVDKKHTNRKKNSEFLSAEEWKKYNDLSPEELKYKRENYKEAFKEVTSDKEILPFLFHFTSSMETEEVLKYMFTNGYNIRSVHYKLLRNRYIAEGYFDKAKQCLSLEYKYKHTELDALRDLAKSTNEFANLIKVRKGGDRTGVGHHGSQLMNHMLGQRMNKLKEAMKNGDEDDILNVFHILNVDPYMRHLSRYRNLDLFICYDTVQADENCTLEFLDELIAENFSDKRFERFGNKLLPDKGWFSAQRLYINFIKSRLETGNIKEAEDIVLELFSRTNGEDGKMEFFRAVGRVFFQEIAFVPKSEIMEKGKLSPRGEKLIKKVEKEYNVSIEPIHGRISRLQHYLAMEDNTIQNALEQLQCDVCGEFGHHARDCKVPRMNNLAPRRYAVGDIYASGDQISKRDSRNILMEFPLLNRYSYEDNYRDSQNPERFNYTAIKLTGTFENVKMASKELKANRHKVKKFSPKDQNDDTVDPRETDRGMTDTWYEFQVQRHQRYTTLQDRLDRAIERRNKKNGIANDHSKQQDEDDIFGHQVDEEMFF